MEGAIQNNSALRLNVLNTNENPNTSIAADDSSILSALSGSDMAPMGGAAANEPSMRDAGSTPMTWGKAGSVVGKHAMYGVSGFLPFAAAATANTVANLYQFGADFISNHGSEGYSAVSALLEATGSSLKVGGALAAAGLVLAYPVGRFLIAPAAQKGYETLVPDDVKEVINFAADEAPVAAKKGYEAISDVAGSAYKAIKNAPETAPAALVSAGVALGGLTQRGADAVAEVTNDQMKGDARYDRAVQSKVAI